MKTNLKKSLACDGRDRITSSTTRKGKPCFMLGVPRGSQLVLLKKWRGGTDCPKKNVESVIYFWFIFVVGVSLRFHIRNSGFRHKIVLSQTLMG
jgi:hypothetical protein